MEKNLENLNCYEITLRSSNFKDMAAYNTYRVRFLNISPKIEFSEGDTSSGKSCTFTLNPRKVDTVAEYYTILNKMTALYIPLLANR